MKFGILSIAAAVSTSQQFALAEQEIFSDSSIAFALAPFTHAIANQASLSRGRSLIILSIAAAASTLQQCKTETLALSENSDLVAAVQSIGQSCPPLIDGTTVKVDFESCSSAMVDKVQIACTSAGGNYTTVPSVHITCTANGETINVTMSNTPDCIGNSCDGSTMESDEGKKELANMYEQELAAAGIYATCNSASSAVLNKTVMVGGILSLLALLLN